MIGASAVRVSLERCCGQRGFEEVDDLQSQIQACTRHLSAMSERPSQSQQRPRLLTSNPYLSPVSPSSISPSTSPETANTNSPLLPSPLPANFGPPSPTITRPTMSRLNTHRPSLSYSLNTPHSVSTPASPYLTPQTSSLNVPQNNMNLLMGNRLLMPTIRAPRSPNVSPRIPPSTKSSPSKLSRSRASSVSRISQTQSPELSHAVSLPQDWIGGGCKFEVVANELELEGFQIYAVEKWIVERKRPVTVLTVYTGDPRHRITVTALAPAPSLSPTEAQAEWQKAMHLLRRDGARPKETDKGVVMVTSLANFRSDYTIVHIPQGNFLDVREHLYTNINILRMGCSGRSALTLEEPSDTTKERFLSMFQMPDKALARSQALFRPTVLELVKLIQAGLSIFGCFELCPEDRNGLLCDVTCDGIQKWIAEIGEPCLAVEPMERVVDPTLVAALFSMILCIRNKLHALGHPVPKDPFIDPVAFIRAVTSFHNSTKSHSHSHSLSLSYHSSVHLTPQPSSATLPSSPSTSTTQIIYLTQPLIISIGLAHDKLKQSESYKVHRVLINKLDDLATDLRTTNANHPETTSRSGGWGGWWSNVLNEPTKDLDKFVRVVVLGGNAKEGAASLKYLWSGRPEEVGRRRREKEVLSEGEEEKEKDREGGGKVSLEKEVRSSEDEGDYPGGRPWGGRVQKKIESWAAITRTKKLSVDFSKGKIPTPESPPRNGGPSSPSHRPQHNVPAVVISKDPDDEDILSSGQASPVSDSHTVNPLMLGIGAFPAAGHSTGELSDYDRRVVEFNQRRPTTKSQARIISWSDPVTARGMLDTDDESTRKLATGSLGKTNSGSSYETSLLGESEGLHEIRRTRLRGRRSFDDVEKLKDSRILPMDRMRIDVELCGQLLVMRRRELHLANVLACLEALTHTLSSSNTLLQNELKSHQDSLALLESRSSVLQDIENARIKADGMTQETNALAYEFEQFHLDDLWHMASQPRQKVFMMREKVFGTGRRLGQGVHGAHGQFNRIQWRIDGTEVLVDALGRTESEVEEEMDLPGSRPLLEEEEEGEVVEHPGLRPTWLLRVFNYLGSRWRSTDKKVEGNGNVLNGNAAVATPTETPLVPSSKDASSTSVQALPSSSTSNGGPSKLTRSTI
ncbi:hypothetical protein ABKN59_000448 [Abortiporus biennis]